MLTDQQQAKARRAIARRFGEAVDYSIRRSHQLGDAWIITDVETDAKVVFTFPPGNQRLLVLEAREGTL